MREHSHRVFVACYLFLKRGSKVLLLRRYRTGYKDGFYTMVSGHIDEGETPITAMKREAKEEAGIEIRPDSLKVVHVEQRQSPDREYVDFYLTADKWTGEPRNMEPNKCDDMRWFDADDLPANTISYIPIVIKKIGEGELFSHYTEQRSPTRKAR